MFYFGRPLQPEYLYLPEVAGASPDSLFYRGQNGWQGQVYTFTDTDTDTGGMPLLASLHKHYLLLFILTNNSFEPNDTNMETDLNILDFNR